MEAVQRPGGPAAPAAANPAAVGGARRPAPAGMGDAPVAHEGRGLCRTGINYVSWLVKGSYNLFKTLICCCFKRESAAIRQVRKEIRSLRTLSPDAIKAKAAQNNLYGIIGEHEWKAGRRVTGVRRHLPGVPFVNDFTRIGQNAVTANHKVAIPVIKRFLEGRILAIRVQQRATAPKA